MHAIGVGDGYVVRGLNLTAAACDYTGCLSVNFPLPRFMFTDNHTFFVGYGHPVWISLSLSPPIRNT